MKAVAAGSRQVHMTVASIVLALFLQPMSRAAGQQTPADGKVFPSTDALPDSPGAVLSASMRAQAPTQQEPAPDAPAAVPRTDEQKSDTANNPQQAPAATESQDQAPVSSAGADQSQQSGATSQGAQQQQPPQRPHEPVGTAASESVAVTGVAGSRPAGAAVAPAKQRRVRSLLIKVGAVVGVAAAVGTTMALSQGSPSKPPGTH